MKKFLRKFFIWTGIIIGILILLLVATAAFFEKPIGKKIIKQVNKQLKEEAQLSVGDFELSLLSSFPSASANLQNVVLEDALGGTLVDAEKIAFRFKLFSLFGSNIKVKSVLLQNGMLNIVQADSKGRANYDIFKSDESSKQDTTDSNDLALSIEKAELENISLKYLDALSKQVVHVEVEKAQASGNFSSSSFTLDSYANILSRKVELEGATYLVDKLLSYDAELNIDMEKGLYEMKDVALGIGNNFFKVDGWVENNGGNTDMDLKIASERGSIESILAILPAKYLKGLEDLQSEGDLSFKASMVGRYNKTSQPKIKAELLLEDGRLSNKKLKSPLKDVSFAATFSNGETPSNKLAVFRLENFKGYLNRERIEMDLTVANLDDPLVDFRLDGVLPMEAAYRLLDNPVITDGNGEIELKNIQVKGRYNDMIRTSRIGNVRASGEVELDDASLTVNREKITFDKGRLLIDNNDFTLEDFKLLGPDTDIAFEGACANLLPVLLADSLNTQKAELRFDASLVAKKVDIDRMMALSELPTSSNTATEAVVDSLKEQKVQQRERITDFMKGTFRAKAYEYNYNKIKGKDFTGSIEFDNNEMKIKGKTEGVGGHFEVDGKMFFRKEPYLQVKLFADRVDVTEFFRQTDNFGQDILTNKNLRGTLDAKIAIFAFWDEEGNFLMDDLKVLSDVNIRDGELVDFEMLYEFSDYIHLDDLRRIKFTEMQNWLEIKDHTVTVPVMFIQSNAMNLTLSGQQSFDDQIDYNIKVNASQIVVNKIKKHDADLDPLPAKRKGFFNLHFNIRGTVDDYEIQRKKKLVKAEFEASERVKQRIQNELVDVFGTIVNLTEPVDWEEEIPEHQEEGDPEDVEYLDWEG